MKYPEAYAMADKMDEQINEILKASGAEILPYKKSNPEGLGPRRTRAAARAWEMIRALRFWINGIAATMCRIFWW